MTYPQTWPYTQTIQLGTGDTPKNVDGAIVVYEYVEVTVIAYDENDVSVSVDTSGIVSVIVEVVLTATVWNANPSNPSIATARISTVNVVDLRTIVAFRTV